METAIAAPDPGDDKEKSKLTPIPANKVFTFVPQNLTEAMSFAKMLAESDLVPKDYKGKPGNCLIGMQYGAELGLPPLQALQCIAVINGKPGIYGDMGKALLQSKGFGIEERDVPETKTKGQAWCRITRPPHLNPTRTPPTERTYSIEDAKTASLWGKQGPWTTNPYRQMAWRAFWFAARDAASDILKGLGGVEELNDYVETTATEEPTAPREITAAEPTKATPAVDVPRITVEQRKHIFALKEKHKVSDDALKAHLATDYKITGTDQLPSAKYAELCNWLEDPQEELIGQ